MIQYSKQNKLSFIIYNFDIIEGRFRPCLFTMEWGKIFVQYNDLFIIFKLMLKL